MIFVLKKEVIFLFGDKLKELRIKNKLSQEKLGDILHVRKSSISNWETNKATPTFETLNQISDFFGVSIDFLLGKNYDKLEKLKVSLKENGMMQGDDLSLEELEKALKIVETLKEKK